MKFVQIGELGKAVAVASSSQLPAAGVLFLNKFYVATDTKVIYTCVKDSDGSYSWKVVKVLPTLTNGIISGTQLVKDVEAISATGNKIVGTFELGTKEITANGTYRAADDNLGGYSSVTVDMASGTAENPYIVTTDSELETYKSDEYVGSFIRIERAAYRNVELPHTCRARGNMFDTYLGQYRVNKYIDYLTDVSNNQKIITTEGQGTFTVASTSVTADITGYVNAYKTTNSDGTIFRALFALISYSFGDPVFKAMPIYYDNLREDTVLPSYTDPTGHTTTTVTFNSNDFVESSHNINGWYQDGSAGSDIPEGEGYLTASYWLFSNTQSVIYLYKNAAVLAYEMLIPVDSDLIVEHRQQYQELGIYKVSKSVSQISQWSAESPLQVGDTLQGATLYFNTNLTFDEVDALIQAHIPSSEYSDAGMPVAAEFNCDNPMTDINELYKGMLGIFYMADPDGTGKYGISSYNVLLAGIDLGNSAFVCQEDGWKVSSVALTNSITSDDNTTIALDATITKINHEPLLNQLVGKTANFTKGDPVDIVTYYFEQYIEAGTIQEIGYIYLFEHYIADKNNIGKIVRYTAANVYEQGEVYIVLNTGISSYGDYLTKDKYHTVTFDSNGGSSVDSQVVLHNTKAVRPTSPTKSGASFDEWQLDGSSFSFSTLITKDITLVAAWL